ncbi:DUF3467 domain-containing protein [Sphingomonas sp. 4RDLI-65]|uniref:DUF3467 domain-containing protein n=1 Tax=Sphingomonas sp. 4RDLI-65 TaxID=3111641 RepID=UPI003C17B01F
MTPNTSSTPTSTAPGDLALATYANYCEVGYNAFEFLLDFGQFRPEARAVNVHSRIVAGPVQAKLFARLLADAIARFESAHGAIADLDDEDPLSALITSLPEFEHRATTVRAQPLSPSPSPPPGAMPPSPR